MNLRRKIWAWRWSYGYVKSGRYATIARNVWMAYGEEHRVVVRKGQRPTKCGAK